MLGLAAAAGVAGAGLGVVAHHGQAPDGRAHAAAAHLDADGLVPIERTRQVEPGAVALEREVAPAADAQGLAQLVRPSRLNEMVEPLGASSMSACSFEETSVAPVASMEDGT